VGYVGAGNIGIGVVEGVAAAMNEVAVACPILCAGSAQSPARVSRQCALHIRRPQPLRIRVELHPTIRHVAFRGAAEGIDNRFCWPPVPGKKDKWKRARSARVCESRELTCGAKTRRDRGCSRTWQPTKEITPFACCRVHISTLYYC